MQRTLRVTMALAASLTPAPCAHAASATVPSDMVPCKLEGWSTDKDPNGLNVRAAPNASAAILARLPPRPQAESGSLVQFEILGVRDGWLLIKGASYGDYGDPPPATPLYSGMGWVHGSRVGGQVIGGQNVVGLYSEPKDSAKRLPRPKQCRRDRRQGVARLRRSLGEGRYEHRRRLGLRPLQQSGDDLQLTRRGACDGPPFSFRSDPLPIDHRPRQPAVRLQRIVRDRARIA